MQLCGHIQRRANNYFVPSWWCHTAESLHKGICLDHIASSSRADGFGAASQLTGWQMCFSLWQTVLQTTTGVENRKVYLQKCKRRLFLLPKLFPIGQLNSGTVGASFLLGCVLHHTLRVDRADVWGAVGFTKRMPQLQTGGQKSYDTWHRADVLEG